MRHLLPLLLLLLSVGLAACQQGSSEDLVIYSGRSQALVDGLVDRYEQRTDRAVSVRYGSDAQLLAALQEEGENSQADLFWANTTGALAEAINAGLLTQLPDSILEQAAAYQPENGQWTPITTRFRVLAYNSEAVDPSQLPASVMDLPDLSEYEGRIGWTPAYSSFQDFITAMRTIHGREATQAWIQGMEELNPNAYTSNTPMIQALAAGEIDIALTNHYYVLRLKHDNEEGEETSGQSSAPVETYHFEDGDVGNLALVTGAGLLGTNDQPEAAQQFLSFLLSPEAQEYAATEVHEYPVVEGVSVPDYMTSVEQALSFSPDFNFEELQDLDATLELLRAEGLL